jgi:PilZ domain
MTIHRREARRDIRYPLEASVAFCCKAENGTDQQGNGRSRDISESGLFIFANGCPPLEVKIKLRISVTEFHDIARALRLHVEGYVLRVDKLGAGPGICGFAVLNDGIMLKENDGNHD